MNRVRRRHKYGANKVEIDGIKFDSQKEAIRYKELKLLERVGKISALELQPRFELVGKYKNGAGKSIRKMEYVADFRYVLDGEVIIEDTKGFKTKDYLLKKKLFEKKFYPLVIKEV